LVLKKSWSPVPQTLRVGAVSVASRVLTAARSSEVPPANPQTDAGRRSTTTTVGTAPTQKLVGLVAAANHIADPNLIIVGQVINFPPVRSALVPPVSCAHTATSWLQWTGFALFGGLVAFLAAVVALVAAVRRYGFQQAL
jgi:hypothetical protein